jgi:mannose-6-phosphate isomerase-like protein (cupin superfamily)
VKESIIPLIAFTLCIISCKEKNSATRQEGAVDKEWPDTSYWNKAVSKFDTSDYVVQLKHMQEFYDVPGEFGYIAEGKDYGFNSLSFILTNTQPQGGPPLHVHSSEEAHVLQEGSILYTMGGKTFTATGPYIVRIPAGVPHTFINTGKKPLQLTAVFPTNVMSYTELGRNPLIKDSSLYHKKQATTPGNTGLPK